MASNESDAKSGKVVKNASTGHGFKYSNLADLSRAGVKIPKMKTGLVEGEECVFYLDEEKNEWQQGAKVVVIESKMMNAAQAYGAALTYARRYTVQLAEKVACDDDDAIDQASGEAKPQPQRISSFGFDELRAKIANMTPSELSDYEAEVMKKQMTYKQKAAVQAIFEQRKAAIMAKNMGFK